MTLPVFVLENLPVFDIISDVYLLATEWPKTATNAPSDLGECSTWRSLWYVALGFTIVGTLVDLVPEALMLTELILNPRIFMDGSALWKVLKLLCSDGKPIISFAASQDDVGDTLGEVRTSLRKRCKLYDHYRFKRYDDTILPGHRIFSGMQGSLAAGEILTAVGAALFLSIEFSWPAFASIVWSFFAFLSSTRKNMMAVNGFEGHLPAPFCGVDQDDSPRFLLAMGMPGPVTFLRFVLAVPLWPISLSLWGIFESSPSDEHVWVWPPSWFGVSGFSSSRTLDWFLFPHYICNWALAPMVLLLLGLWAGWILLLLAILLVVFLLEILFVGTLWRWYFGRPDEANFRMEWTWMIEAMIVETVFVNHQINIVVLLELFGSALSTLVATYVTFGYVVAFFVVQAAVLGIAISSRDCAEQEWTLASAHLGWSLVLLCAKACSRSNPFSNPFKVGYENDEGTPENGPDDEEGGAGNGYECEQGIPEVDEVDRSTVDDPDPTRTNMEAACAQ